MSRVFDTFVGLARLSLESPRQGARAVLGFDLPPAAGALALALVAVCSALISQLVFHMVEPIDEPLARFLLDSPIRSAILQWVVLAGMVVLIYRIGRMLGGTGSLSGALTIVVWVEILMFAVQAALLVLMILMPFVAGLFNLAAVALFFWLLSGFVAELHGFRSRLATFVGILGTGFVAAFVLVFVLALIFGPEALSNV